MSNVARTTNQVDHDEKYLLARPQQTGSVCLQIADNGRMTASNPTSNVIRLPSFNDFSPGIIGNDIRRCLRAVKKHGPVDARVISEWANEFFDGKVNKRSSVNIPATLVSTGLATRGPLTLTAFGKAVLAEKNPVRAARLFCKTLIKNSHGELVILAISNLNKRNERISKDSLKKELQLLGVTALSTGTTDHTTLRNWMVVAGYLADEKAQFAPNDALLQKDCGFSTQVLDALSGLTTAQRIFLLTAKRRAIGGSASLTVAPVIAECVVRYRGLFDDDQLRKKVLNPLESDGWISTAGVSVTGRGGKSGSMTLQSKTLELADAYLIPSADVAVPADLRRRLNTPLSEIATDLQSSNKHKRGIALELLALRMVIDLGLDPRGFRTRSVDTAFAEVDLIAEGAHLQFSRWAVQCKNTSSRVSLSAVAKEVGIAVYSRAHVVMVVTTSSFSRDATGYALEVSRSTHLQFVLVEGKHVRAYLRRGADSLLEFVYSNARQVMAEKRVQPTGVGTTSSEVRGLDSVESVSPVVKRK